MQCIRTSTHKHNEIKNPEPGTGKKLHHEEVEQLDEISKEKLHASVKSALAQLNLNSKQIDLIQTKFKADKTGLDKLYDLIDFSVTTACDITLTNKNSKVSVTIESLISAVAKVESVESCTR